MLISGWVPFVVAPRDLKMPSHEGCAFAAAVGVPIQGFVHVQNESPRRARAAPGQCDASSCKAEGNLDYHAASYVCDVGDPWVMR